MKHSCSGDLIVFPRPAVWLDDRRPIVIARLDYIT